MMYPKLREIPEEVIASHVEVQEEMMQKVTGELDQMFIEDDADGNEDVEYFDLVEVPDSENVTENDLENVSENTTEKIKFSRKLLHFSLLKNIIKFMNTMS